MIKSLNHIGIAVKNLQKSIDLFKTIFDFDLVHKEIIESQKVEIASFEVGDILIELTAPTDIESPIAKFIEKRGEGIHHIAFETDNIQKDLDKFSSEGIKLINENPQSGANNMEIAFLHPKSTNGILMEICQTKN